MKTSKRVLSILLCMTLVFGAVAVGGLTASAETYGDYKYSVSDGKAKITKYTGEGGNIDIPAEINGIPVTIIGDYAFEDCTDLTSITIPDSVTSIGEKAFYRCIQLTSITIPDSVTSIGDYAFTYCNRLESVTIGNSVTSIGDYAFTYCNRLESVTIGNSVTSIGESVFEYCTGLTSITVDSGNTVYHSKGNCLIETGSKTLIAGCKNSIIPGDGSVTSIGESAFESCGALTSVTIPDSVTSIGESAFYDCTGLTSITIPGSVTSIGDDAFGYCKKITSITIPDSVTSIGKSVFEGCTGLTGITVDPGNTVYHSKENCLIETGSKTIIAGCKNSIIPGDGSVTSIGDSAFEECTGLTGVTIPDSVTSIGDSAFNSCTGLTSVTIGNSVTSIGERAFSYCDGLTDITIPDSVTSIGRWAFFVCKGLTSVTIPNSVTSIGDSAFGYCNENLIINFVGTSEQWDNLMAGRDNSDLKKFEVNIARPDGYEGNYGAFSYTLSGGEAEITGCERDTAGDVSIPEKIEGFTVTGISDGAFYQCTQITGITIPATVTEIGIGAFAACISLESITVDSGNPKYISSGECLIEKDSKTLIAGCGKSVIPGDGSVTEIGPYAFFACPQTEIVIPDTVTKIGEFAFYSCGFLESMTIPDSVTSIGDNVFINCGALRSIEIGKGLSEIGRGLFAECPNLESITVDSENPKYISTGNCLIEKDSKTLVAGCLSSVIPEDGSVTEIGEYAFFGVYGKEELTVPENVTSIKDGAFSFNANLKSAIIPPTVTYIGEDAFFSCAEDFTISGFTGSAAWKYAKENEIKFISIGVVQFTATFIADGETVDTVIFTVEDDRIAEPKVPEKTGYEGKWEEYKLDAEDITVNAVYIVNEYTVTYVIDGNETKVNYKFGAAVAKPADPVKEGYKFTGWDKEIPETMPAEDLTITAEFEIIPEPVEPTPTEPTPTEPTSTEPTPTETDIPATPTETDVPATPTEPTPTEPDKPDEPGKPDNPSQAEPTIKIKNYKQSLSVDYKAKLTFHAEVKDADGYEIVWLVNDSPSGQKGDTFTIDQATEKEYKISTSLVKDGKTVKTSDEETVTVNTGFFAKIIAFFRGLFKALPEYVDNEKVK